MNPDSGTTPGGSQGGSSQGGSVDDDEPATVLYGKVLGAVPARKSEYNGTLVSPSGDVAGTIKVVVGKPRAKTGASNIKATVLVGGRKVTMKSSSGVVLDAASPTEVSLSSGGESCVVVIGSDALGGFYGGSPYMIDGARNFFTSSLASEKAAAKNLVVPWTESPVAAYGSSGCLSVKITSAGKAKIRGTLAGGVKVSASTCLLVGEKWLCVPAVDAKKSLYARVWLSREGGRMAVDGLGGDEVVDRPGVLENGAVFSFQADPGALAAALPGAVFLDYLNDVPVSVSSGKWILPAAGKVVYERGTTTVDTSKLLSNPAALKLKYSASTGIFTGSFKVYSDVSGRVVSRVASVVGVLAGGEGHGTASVNGYAAPVTIRAPEGQ